MIEDQDLDLIVNHLVDKYGYDFTNYARASLKRRISRVFTQEKFSSINALQEKIKNNTTYLNQFVEALTVNVTEMFRDPSFYKTLRTNVFNTLTTKPFIRIWHAGCSTGEEVYSMAILLKEANLLQKSLLYATDLNATALDMARKGIFPLHAMKQYSENYIASGGQQDFSSYYTAHYGLAKFDETLAEKMIFSTHNLVSDGSFNEFDLIICRNVLIYFNKELQDQVLQLFDESLGLLGYLGLGSKETIKFSGIQSRFKQLPKEKIWRKLSG